MEESKYSNIIKDYTYEQLVYERAIMDNKKKELYIQDKELNDEFQRRLKEEKR